MRQAGPVGIGFLRKIMKNGAENFRDWRSENSSRQPALKCSNPLIVRRGKIVLEVKNLNVSIGGRKILVVLDLPCRGGGVAVLMGPNGSGKSTLSHVIAGRKDYIAETGDVLLNGESILNLEPDVRAAKGLFLAFQYPVEIPGVATFTFLKAALNAQRKQRGQEEFSTPAFMKCVRASAGQLEISADMLKRALNVGFSGGEKKRMDILQMALL